MKLQYCRLINYLILTLFLQKYGHHVFYCVYFSQSVNSDLSSDTKAILDEITRCLNLEKLLSCYRHTVTVRLVLTYTYFFFISALSNPYPAGTESD